MAFFLGGGGGGFLRYSHGVWFGFPFPLVSFFSVTSWGGGVSKLDLKTVKVKSNEMLSSKKFLF